MTIEHKKTASGFFWNFLEMTSSQVINFIGIWLLARFFLSPTEFGLITYTVIFTSIAQVFVDSGFSQALIRKQNCTNIDYSTVFFINISLGIILYALLYVTAPFIASYYDEPTLTLIIRVITLSIPLSAFSLVHRTILVKDLNFKLQAIISIIGTTCGFLVAIGMALYDYGVWSLVGRIIATQVIMVLLLWILNAWRPEWRFSKASFSELFGFGSKLLIIYLMATTVKGLYNNIIGKIYSTKELGNYSQADTLANVPSSIITTLINKVAYSSLSALQNDNNELREQLRLLMRPILLLSFTSLFVLAVIGKDVILLLYGNKWIGAIFYFQVLCVAYIAVILHTENQIIMNIKGRSDYFLWTEIIKSLLFIPVIIIGYYTNVRVLVICFAIHCWIGFLLNALFTQKLIGYGIWSQLKDLLPLLIYALSISGIVFIFNTLLISNLNLFAKVIIEILVAFISAVIIAKIFKVRAYHDVKNMLNNIFIKH